jgi:hypothetical protein
MAFRFSGQESDARVLSARMPVAQGMQKHFGELHDFNL